MAKRETPKKHHLFKLITIVNLILLIIVILGLVKMHKTILELVAQVQQNAPSVNYVAYECDDDKTINAAYLQNSVEINLSGGRSFMLMQAVSASGIRYTNSDETITFWSKGNGAFLEEGPENTVTYDNCTEKTAN